MTLVHGSCGQPDHCECEKDWFGVQCDKKCDKARIANEKEKKRKKKKNETH